MNGDTLSSASRGIEKITAIVCAAGKGSRAGFGSNKVLKAIQGISVLERTICAFVGANVNEIVVAASPCDRGEIAPLCARYGAILSEGGEYRARSRRRETFRYVGNDRALHRIREDLQKRRLCRSRHGYACLGGRTREYPFLPRSFAHLSDSDAAGILP